ncbi:uncharacterized protein ARMOST_02522 [Armillaria ostoyae]|uniref:Uncharacterized protein n=1 Tax=Armillaria ostoyae TaxID=47428 RepID=A0A284QS64_ARMOS|nr:uncharacterized protein ARMOST_02522 [Armillaria ostoyae]
MTPDEIAILVAGLIGGSALLSLLVALLVLTYADQLRRIFRVQPLAPVNPALPGHYVLPYLEPRPLMEPMGQIHAPTPQRRTTFAATSSDEHLPPRNATPGPSNVPRTPPPAYNPEEAEEYGRFLRSIFRSASPDSLPLITIPDSPPAPTRPLHQELNAPTPRTPSPLRRQRLSGTLHPGGIRISTPAHLCPLPDSDSESNSGSDSSDYGGNEPVAEREDDDPLNPNGSDHEWPELDAVDRAFLGPYRSQAWELRQLDIEQRSRYKGPENRVRMGYYLATERGPRIPRRGREATIRARIHANRFREEFPTSAGSIVLDARPRTDAEQRALADILLALALAQETFGGWADEEDDMNTALDYGDYRGYTSAPHFYHQPFPLPDSPTYQHPARPPPHPTPAASNSTDHPSSGITPGEGKDPTTPSPAHPTCQPTPLNQAMRNDSRRPADSQKRTAMEAAQAKMMTHDITWDFAQPPTAKGKEPDRGRPPIPNY